MSKRILIVEDEKNLARFVSLELQHEGYDVVTADNGREGLEMALEKDFDLKKIPNTGLGRNCGNDFCSVFVYSHDVGVLWH